MSAKPALEPTLRALVARDRRGLSQHPTPEVLVAYHAGELSGAEEEELRDHLALCPDCAELLLDLVSFAEFNPPEEPATLANSEVEAAWQKVQPQVVSKKLKEAAPVLEMTQRDPEPRRPPKPDAAYETVTWRRKIRVAYAIAATLFLGVVGLSVWGVSLRNRVATGSKPRANIVFTTLLPEGETSRGPAAERKPIPSEGSFLSLELADLPPDAEYVVDLVDSSGHTVWTSANLHRVSEDKVLTFELPPGLHPGDYQAQLFPVENGRRGQVTVYKLSIAAPTGR